jgi:hypothetical protein
MKKILIIILLFSFFGCGKPKTVLICGDHVCINKEEAKQYFEENLSIEVKLVDVKDKNTVDLVELNLKESSEEQKQVKVYKKEKTNKEIKILTDDEIEKIKDKIKVKKRKKKNKPVKKIDQNIVRIDQKSRNIVSSRNYDNDGIDVCRILDKCNIDEISKFLLSEGKKRNFPDITAR